MESEILKIICASQGAVNTDDLLFNLDATTVSEIISNRERFVLFCRRGQPKVAARTGLRLCRARGCPGGCRGLHLCRVFLHSGDCRFTSTSRGCSSSHELRSDHNEAILREHELESLSRAELCTLLLQNDPGLLPAICHDYNNGMGEFGKCQEGNGCKRLHICERYLIHDCSCDRTHDFSAPQPLKTLQDRGVPRELFPSLKALYANKDALRLYNKGNRGTSDASAAATGTDASSDAGLVLRPMQWYRGRGRGGHRGNRGNRGRGNQGNRQQPRRSCSSSDIQSDINASNLFAESRLDQPGSQLNSSNSDISTAANDSDISATADDTDTSSEAGQRRRRTQKTNKPVGAGNCQQLQETRYTNYLTSAAGVKDANGNGDPNRRRRPPRDKTEICMYFIKGYCKHKECFKAHDTMPYRWEVREDNRWKALPDNEAIEEGYCDPKNTYSSSSPPVHFDTMTCGTNKVRRLSTINSLLKPDFIHTTEWVWYWEDEFGKWNLYASATAGHKLADIDSAYLEKKFLDNDKDVVEFTAGSQSYTLSFQDMIQTNKRYSTKRLVRRRPRFVSAADVKEKRVRRPLGQPTFAPIPDQWDKAQIPTTGYALLSLQRSSEEFKEIEALFCKTMTGFDIVQIERIQNKALWNAYQLQKNQMKEHNGGRNVMEKKLFHGTNSKHVNAICVTNFDWRICGTHGTAYGKGSYFARDAKYSHSYTDDSNVKSMFVSRVLVGEFTKGSPDYLRPPSKDGGDVNFYDSCVDNVVNPSIFVLFEKQQIYPEYLLQYKILHPPVQLYGGSSAPVPAPRAAPQPKSPVYKSSTVSHQPNLSVYKPSTPSYLSSTSSYPSSTSSYPASTSSYPASTSSYPSSTSSYPASTSSYPASTPSNPFGTASYSSSTSSYQNRTSPKQAPMMSNQFSLSPASSPKPKKSDSCVIA